MAALPVPRPSLNEGWIGGLGNSQGTRVRVAHVRTDCSGPTDTLQSIKSLAPSLPPFSPPLIPVYPPVPLVFPCCGHVDSRVQLLSLLLHILTHVYWATKSPFRPERGSQFPNDDPNVRGVCVHVFHKSKCRDSFFQSAK